MQEREKHASSREKLSLASNRSLQRDESFSATSPIKKIKQVSEFVSRRVDSALIHGDDYSVRHHKKDSAHSRSSSQELDFLVKAQQKGYNLDSLVPRDVM